MASEASVADQTVSEQIETNVSDVTSNADEASLSKPEDLRGKDEEEKVKVEVSASVEAPIAEPGKKLEEKEGGAVIEEVKEDAVDKSVSEPSVEAEEKELIDKTEAPITPELPNEPVEQPAPELPNEPAEKPAPELPTVEQSAPELPNEPVVQPASELPNEPVEQPAPELPNEPVEQLAPELPKEPVEKPAPELPTVEQPAPELPNEPVEQPAPELPNEPVEKLAPELPNEPVEQPTPELPNEPVEQPAPELPNEPVEQPAPKLPSEPLEKKAPELPDEPLELPAVVSDVSVTQVSFETPKEPALSEIVTEEAEGVEESSEVPVVPDAPLVTDDKTVEAPTVSLVQEPDPDATLTLNANETAEKPQDGKPTSDGIDVSPESSKEELPRNETSESISEDSNNKVHETIESESSEATVVVPSVDEPKEVAEETIFPELPSEETYVDHNADLGTKVSAEENASATTFVTTEVAECAVEPEVNVEKEMQENNVDDEKTTLSENTQTIDENEVAGVSKEVKASEGVEVIGQVQDESLEGEKLTLVETPRDIDLVGAENNKVSSRDPECDSKELDTETKPAVKQTLLDKMASESSKDKKQETEKVNDQTLAETTKDGGDTKTDEEAPKSEVPRKKSQSQGNNIISKVKKSIVKVKKAIIGKSPSSKTMTPEGNSDTKAK